MAINTENTGKTGENLACKYLVKSGYQVLARNYKDKPGEIDIVCRHKDKTLVFVEVKALTIISDSGLAPEDHMTLAKLEKLSRICRMFVHRNPGLIDERRGWRIDLIAIDLGKDKPEIRHYENV